VPSPVPSQGPSPRKGNDGRQDSPMPNRGHSSAASPRSPGGGKPEPPTSSPRLPSSLHVQMSGEQSDDTSAAIRHNFREFHDRDGGASRPASRRPSLDRVPEVPAEAQG
jgi:hypothetical protein